MLVRFKGVVQVREQGRGAGARGAGGGSRRVRLMFTQTLVRVQGVVQVSAVD